MAAHREKATACRGCRPDSFLRSLLRLSTVLVFVPLFLLVLFHWVKDDPIGLHHYFGRYTDWDAKREVKDASITSWDACLANAWGLLLAGFDIMILI